MHHLLKASGETCHWGFFDATLKPRLTIKSGDQVTIQTVTGGPDMHPPKEAGFYTPPEIADVHAHAEKTLPGHILTGPDHLMFVLGLLLLSGIGWRIVKVISAFTVAHSITLALAALGYIHFPSAVIEALVALSIVFVAFELVPRPDAPPSLTRRFPWLIAFVFGLLHGMAFAGALAAIGLPARAAPQALLLFNLGVELGQLMFIAGTIGVIFALRWVRARVPLDTAMVARLAPAYAIGGCAMFWLFDRLAAAYA